LFVFLFSFFEAFCTEGNVGTLVGEKNSKTSQQFDG